MNVIDGSVEVVGEQESVRAGAENATGPAFNFSVDKEAGDKIARLAIVLREPDNAIACADFGMTGAVQRDQECVCERRIVRGEVVKAQW